MNAHRIAIEYRDGQWVSFNFLPAPLLPVIPAQAGIHKGKRRITAWIPACAGMTGNKVLGNFKVTHYPVTWRGVVWGGRIPQRVAADCLSFGINSKLAKILIPQDVCYTGGPIPGGNPLCLTPQPA